MEKYLKFKIQSNKNGGFSSSILFLFYTVFIQIIRLCKSMVGGPLRLIKTR